MTEQSPAEQLFFAALAVPPAERAAFLAANCPDPAVLARVEKLLAAQPKVGDFLAAGPAAGTGTFDEAAPTAAPGEPTADFAGKDEHLGAVLAGKYRLIEAIGEGGMGSVFLAQQTEPVKRAVAVKVIKAGMDSKAVLARFEAERQALALMDHPNIARVLDAGTTDSGRPFFVMELVKGVPITQFCDDRRLTPRQRLELFVPVCQAIQHAHQKGVIHRDIKPSNVLVALYDDRPVPKVIDFGVAKAAGQTLTDKTLMTGFGAVVGTPEYMSPEQASLNNLDVDTRSDVYSLGVLLYELLTGSTPVDRKALGQAAILEVLRVVREVEAPKPSHKLSTSAALPSVATNRGTEPAKLSKLMRGELDWLVLKALEKDRARRYDTANGLARDIQRYLADEVVEARPPTAGYRVRKFVRRHSGQVVAASLLLFALLAGMAGTTLGLVEAKRQQRLAIIAREEAEIDRSEAESARQTEAAQRQQAEDAKSRAVAKEVEANEVLRFFEDKVFAAARPKGQYGGLGHSVTLRDAIAASLPALSKRFTNQPLVEVRLRNILGLTFLQLGDYQSAEVQTLRGYELSMQVFGSDDLATLALKANLAVCYSHLGRHADALKLDEEILATHRRLSQADHPDLLNCMVRLAVDYNNLGRPADALRLNEETLAVQKRVLPPDHPDTLKIMCNLANCYDSLDRHTDALKLREQTLATHRRVLSPDHPDTLGSMYNLVRSYISLGRHADAVSLGEQTLAAHKRVLPPDHPDTLTSMGLLANCYTKTGRHADALRLNEETLAAQKRALPPDHPDTLNSMWRVAAALVRLDRGGEAIPIIDDCVPRAAGRVIDPRMIPTLVDLRLRHFQKTNDPAGCRATAEMWEKLNRPDAGSLYDAACFRAVTSAVQAMVAGADAARLSVDDANRAMAWLTKAVTAGYRDRKHMVADADLDALRGRADFRELLTSLPETAPRPRPVK